MPLYPGSRTLSAVLLCSWAPALAVGAADGRCAEDGQCRAPASKGATRGSALVQLKTSLGAKVGRAHGERRMLKFFQGQMVVNSTESLLQTGSMRPCTDSEKAAFVDAHNMARCMHGSPAVVWSDAVAASANDYAGPLTSMKHSDSYNIAPPAGPAGENLYQSWQAGSSPSDVVSLWYDEVTDCQGGPSGFTDGCFSGVNGKVTGHFTALIWKGVKEIGCAWSNDGKIALCRYKADDYLNSNTPNMQPQSNYVAQVPPKVKTVAQCSGSSGPSPTPSPPAPTPSQPAPTPSPPAPTPSPPAPTPASDCQDSSTYTDPYWGADCAGWAGYKCSGFYFSKSLKNNCPAACGICTPGASAPTPAPPTPAPPTPAPPTPAPPTPAPPTPAPPSPAPPTPAPATPAPATPAPATPAPATPAPATPAPATPAPATPAPTPLPGTGAGQCVTGTGSGGCVLQSSGCEGQVSFTLKCTHTGGDEFQFQLSMPDDYSWNLNDHCSQCFDIQVI